MKQFIAHIALLVDDYDDAIRFYCEILDFKLIEDTLLDKEKRWILLSPPGAKECCLLLAKAVNEKQRKVIGNQAGGRVLFFLFTDDLWRDYYKMVAKGVNFIRQPNKEDYGLVAVFEDLYGNLWDLLEPNENNKGMLI
jgi:catechol 2,3-dioxygenase-like lactoylglutathione lyase family enzyme